MSNYDDIAIIARTTCKAEGVILVVYHGERGNGLSIQMPPEQMAQMPAILRQLADGMEKHTQETKVSRE